VILGKASNLKPLTVVIKQQSEEFRPPAPFESGIRLSQELARMDQRSVFVEQVHVLSGVSVKRVGLASEPKTYDVLPNFENQVSIVPPQFNLLLSRDNSGFGLLSKPFDDIQNGRNRIEIIVPGRSLLENVLQQQLVTEETRDGSVDEALHIQPVRVSVSYTLLIIITKISSSKPTAISGGEKNLLQRKP